MALSSKSSITEDGPIFRKVCIPVLALAGIVLAVVMVVWGLRKTPPAEPIATPTLASYPNMVAASGLVEASSENILIGTEVSGLVTHVYVYENGRIKAGEPLFSLDERQLKAQLLVDRANEAVARDKIDEAVADLEQKKDLLSLAERLGDSRAISREELDNRRYAVQLSEAKLATAGADLVAAKAQRELTEVNLERLIVRSPIDAKVLQVNIHPGEYANAGELQTPLMVIGRVHPLNVRVDIDQEDIWRFDPEGKATASIRGNAEIKIPLSFERIVPYVIPKVNLNGGVLERVDTRVLQVIYQIDEKNPPVYVGQQLDVSIKTSIRGYLASSPSVPAKTQSKSEDHQGQQ